MTRYDKKRAVKLVKSKFVESPKYLTYPYDAVPENCREWYLARTPCWIDRYTLGPSVTEEGNTEQIYHYADSCRFKVPYFSNDTDYLERLANKLNYGV